jgi:hypothetical protein
MQKLKVEFACDICGKTAEAYLEKAEDAPLMLPPDWFCMRIGFPQQGLTLPQYACSADCASEVTRQVAETLYTRELPPQFARVGTLHFYVGDPVQEEVSDEPKAAE